MDVCNINLQDEFRISPGDIRGSVEIIKEGRMFMNSLPGGEIPCQDMGGLGLYYADTRFLSCLELKLNDVEPVFLSRALRDSHFAQVEMTNREFTKDGQLVPLQTIHLRLLRMIKDGFYQRIRLVNFLPCSLQLNLRIKLGADFFDIFEVRGTARSRRGELQKPVIRRNRAILSYIGTDNIRRSTEIRFSPAPTRIIEDDPFVHIEYSLKLEPKKKHYFYLRVTPQIEKMSNHNRAIKSDLGFKEATEYLSNDYQGWKDKCLKISSDNESFDYMIRGAVTDLRALSSTYPDKGTILEAGIPWFAAPFGRDSLITAWETLLLNPGIAKETLSFLAKYQGREVNSWRDEQPGKIMHEIRFGEMAAVGEVPHTPYYGSVDSTLWFIILLAEYIRWTGDKPFLLEMAAPLAKALQWCEEYGDIDKDGYIEYQCQSEKGLSNQGWKDSWDGVVDLDGSIPAGPIALVEVQGYYYKALNDAAALYELMGKPQKAVVFKQKAEKLQKQFHQDFWLENRGFLAYALDGRKKAIKTVVSNPGHCLFPGILSDQQAHRVVERLMRPDLFSGWGIRTMSAEETAYNPMSYHNGTVWPHDNAIIGYGMRRAGRVKQLKQIAESLFGAAQNFNYLRLPELFCGFTKHEKMRPVKYPIACDPQAWSVGSTFLLLRALLGIKCRGNEIHISDPHVPEFLQTVRLENVRAGTGSAMLEFTRHRNKTYCIIMETEGNVKVIFEKREV